MRDALGFVFIVGGIVLWLYVYFDAPQIDRVVYSVIGGALFVGGCALIGPHPPEKS